ncbi:hypothetical protein [Phenylobacterium sp.]|uniref:hypothetical protein n=1 Tax=Phenylobacterium sp. TaxID=1871053 RepID=UPI002BEBDB5F|nr:hypothetical protein [Phenylobacterium sp.]HLZ74340.1 hypothetical protein [Phenylobacterium sp.]
MALAALAGPARSQPAGLPAPGAGPAPATPSRDPIGDLLNRGAPGDEDEPDTAGQPRTGPDIPPALLPTGPQPHSYTPAPRTQQDAPVGIDETGKTPDAPPTIRDLAYDARIRSSFASAQSFQGPLDGGWTLADQFGDRYVLQIVDRRDRLEAVWRDLRRPGSIEGSGLVDQIQRNGGDLTLKFTETKTPDLTLTLREAGDGRWSGKLVRGDASFQVTMRRTGP